VRHFGASPKKYCPFSGLAVLCTQ